MIGSSSFACSKHVLLKSWPKPITIRDVASFIEFGLFYSKWIQFYEVKIAPLRDLSRAHYDVSIAATMWTTACQEAWKFIITAILDDPCLARYDARKRCYASTD